jgi:hypothetical protein
MYKSKKPILIRLLMQHSAKWVGVRILKTERGAKILFCQWANAAKDDWGQE